MVFAYLQMDVSLLRVGVLSVLPLSWRESPDSGSKAPSLDAILTCYDSLAHRRELKNREINLTHHLHFPILQRKAGGYRHANGLRIDPRRMENIH